MTSEAAHADLQSARDLLHELHRRVDGDLTWEMKRTVVEALVESIRVDTLEEGGKRECVATITYRFTPIDIRTGAGSGLRSCGSAGTIMIKGYGRVGPHGIRPNVDPAV